MKNIYTLLLLLISTQAAFSQGNVGVGTATPDSSAILDVTSISKGMLMPRMTTAQRDLIAMPAVGLQIFNLDDMCLDMYNGSEWIKNCGLRFTGIDTVTDAWIKRPDFSGGGRRGAVGFSVGSKGYLGTGKYNSTNKKDFWEYDPEGKIWTQIADFEGTARYGAVGFAIGSKGYLGTGQSSVFENDFWEYNPATNDWTELDNLDGPGRIWGVGFSLNGKGYIGTGENQTDLMDFWEYDPFSDSWTEKEPFGGGPRHSAVGTSLNGKGYLGAGKIEASGPVLRDFWQYDPIADNWLVMDSLPEARQSAVGFAIYNKVFIGLGYKSGYPTNFWMYDPEMNEWTQSLEFPGVGRFQAVAFTIGNKGFVGTGLNNNGELSDFWEFRPGAILSNYENTSIVESAYSYTDGNWKREFDDVHLAAFGNLGIGTSKPNAKLEVVGDIIQRNGNVGIGNTSPHAPLHFNNSDDNRKLVFNEVMDNDHQFYGLGSGANLMRYQIAANTAAYAHAFFAATGNAASIELMRIQGNGNVGIGTSSPVQKLHVFGNTIISDKLGIGLNTPNAPLQFGNTVANRKIVLYESHNNDQEFYGFGINGGILRYQVPPNTNHVFYAGVDSMSSVELMRIKANGNVGIGTATPSEKLHVAGNGLFTGTVTASCGLLICSDMRYKIKATPLSNSLQKVLALNGIYYYWDKEHFPEKNFTDDRQIGVSAQELETVLPELVHTDADGYKTVDYSRLTPVLIEAVKDQQRQIEELQQQVKKLIDLMTPSDSVKD